MTFRTCLIILLVSGLWIWNGCSLDEGSPSTHDPALTLTATPQLSLVDLSWPEVKVTGFTEYVILQSSSPIPDAPTPEINQDVIVLTRIDQSNVTTFRATNSFFTPSSCYKLYCQVNDRFMYSPTVCVNSHVTTLQGFFDKTHFEPGQDQLAMFDRVNLKLAAFDLEADQMALTINESQLSFPFMDVNTHAGSTSLFTFDQSGARVRKYSFPDLTFQHSRQLSETLTGGAAEGPYIYLVFHNSLNGFQIWNRNTLSTTDSRAGFTSTRNLAVFQGDPTIVLEVADEGIKRYKVNTQGKVISEDHFATGVTQVSSQNTSHYNEDYYIGGRFATIVDKDAEVIQSLVSGANTFTQFCRFSNDGSKALVLFQDINVNRLQIYDITQLPAASLITEYSLPLASFTDLFVDGEIIYVVGLNFSSGTNQTFILRYPL
jgi:hypothetical protein